MIVDTDRIDEAVLALMHLGLHGNIRTWKSFDWDAVGHLHSKGFISDTVSKAKTVILTDARKAECERLFEQLFTR